MKQVSSGYKNAIKSYGKELDSKITYTQNGSTITLNNTQLNAITPSFESSILKSVMKELKIDSNVEIPKDTIINYQFGVKVNGTYEYINYGNYIVYKVEKKEDTNSYEITCYDKMLYSMVDYEALNITYPITIRNYINAICTKLGLTFANASDEFANYNREIPNELYLNENNDTIGYTFRDVLDELAQVTASTICINNNDELEIRYIPENRTSKNILDNLGGFKLGYLNTSGVFVAQNQTALFNQNIPVEVGETYCYSTNQNIDNLVISYFGANNNFISRVKVSSTDRIVRQVPNNVAYVKLAINYDNSATMTQTIINNLQVMVEKNSTRTSYEPHILVETLDEHSLKNINVNFGQKYGPINSIVLSRGEADNIYIQDEDSITQNGLCEIKIFDNQIMKGNDRVDYLPDLLEKLDGLEYYLNDFASPGITYLELCDRYNVQVGENTYSCIMFNDELNVTQGIIENIHTELPEESETDYTKADKTDRKINQTSFIVDKHTQEINALIEMVQDISNVIVGTGSVTLEDAFKGGLHRLEIKGNISNLFPASQSNLYGYPLIISDDLIVNTDLTISSGVPYQNEIPYPKSTQYPKDSYLQVDDTLYQLKFDYLNYMSEATHDTYVIEEGKQWIERRIGIDSNGDMYALGYTIIEQGPELFINVDSNSTITLLSHPNASLRVEYLLNNKYTSTFAQKVYVDSSIVQTVDSIEQKVSSVTDENGEITSASIKLAINQDESEIKLKGDQISLEGTITANDGFMIDEYGNMTCENGTFNGGNISLYGSQDDWTTFNIKDNDRREMYISPGSIVFEKFNDENNGVKITASDYNIYTPDDDEQVTSLEASIKSNGVNMNLWDLYTVQEYSTFRMWANGTATIVMTSSDGTITASAFVNTSLEEKKKNIKKLEKALDKIKETDVCEYNWENEDTNKKSVKKHYGLVVGDKYKIPKEFIHKDKDGNETGIDIYATLSFCIKAIQEQQEQIEELQKEIKSLKEEKDGKDKLSK